MAWELNADPGPRDIRCLCFSRRLLRSMQESGKLTVRFTSCQLRYIIDRSLVLLVIWICGSDSGWFGPQPSKLPM